MKKITMLLVTMFLTAGSLLAASLDGTQWKVKVVPDSVSKKAGMNGFKNRLVFNNGTVHMTECAKSGYKDSAYQTADSGGSTTWSTSQTSDDKKEGGSSQWEGTISGNKIQGTDLWTNLQGQTYKFTYSGVKIESKK